MNAIVRVFIINNLFKFLKFIVIIIIIIFTLIIFYPFYFCSYLKSIFCFKDMLLY